MSLIKAYESVQIISINPVFDNAVNWKDLEDFYTDIVIEEENEEAAQRIKNEQEFNKFLSFRQMFENNGKKVKRIILEAPAGQGKSTFCRKLVHTWCSVQKKKINILNDDGMSNKSETRGLKDEDEMLRFDVLLYICLRDISDEKTLMDMVNSQFPLHESQDLSHRSHIEALIGQAEENKVLLIMDGLDEMDNSSPFIEKIMQKRLYPNLTVLATTRPWKIGQLSLIRSAHIDLLLALQGFSFDNSMLFAKRIFDKFYKDESAIAQFENDIRRNDVIESLIHVPLLLLFIVHVWYERKSFPQTIHELYLEMLNVMVNRYMEGKERKEKSKERQDKNLVQNLWPLECKRFILTPLESTIFIVNPKLRNLSLVQHFGEEFLAALCEVANHFLVTACRETSLVFDEEVLLKLLGKDGTSKLQTALDLGILSKSESPGIFRKRMCVTFLHKTVQEFLAAMNICCREDRCSIFLGLLNTLDDVFKNEQIIKFAAGISRTLCQKIFDKIYEICDKDRIVLFLPYQMIALSRFYMNCIREACGEPFNLKLFCVNADNRHNWNELQSALRNTLNVRLHLKYLYLDSCILDDATLDLLEFTSLTMLHLKHMTIKGNILLSKYTELKGLGLDCCTLDDDSLDLSESKCLEILRLINVTMKGKLLLSKCTHLKSLKLNRCTLDDATLDLSESNILETLRLVDVNMKGKLLLSRCTHLKRLKLNECTVDNDVLDLSESHGLEYLSLIKVTMKGKLLLSKCTHLKSLKLNDCTLDNDVLDLSESNCLEYLDLKDVTMKGKLLLSKCTHLKCLTLYYCTLDDDVLDLSESNCLEHFSLKDVTMKGKLLLSKCTHLKRLTLKDCILDEATLDLSESKCLEYLCLKDLIMKVRLLLSKCTQLKCLNLASCFLEVVVFDLSECKEVFCNSLSQCKQQYRLSIKNVDLCDALLRLDSVNYLHELSLDNVTMSKECKEVFCNSLSQCKQLERISIKDVDLCDALLSLDSVNYLHELDLDNVTMSKECKEVFCNSLSQYKHLKGLSIKNVDLCDALLSLDSVNYLNELSLDNVTMSKECKEVFCNSLSQYKHLNRLSIKNVDLCDALLSLDSVNYFDELNLDSVTMSKECREVFCNSLSQCKHLRRLSIKNVDLCDALLSLDSVNYLNELILDSVTMSKECKAIWTLSIKNINQFENVAMRKDSKRFFESLSKCSLYRLSIENMDLDDALLSFCGSTLYRFELDNVTISIHSKIFLFVILSEIQKLEYLSLKNLDLSYGIHELYNMKGLNYITLENVKMGTLSKVLMCRSLSQCTQLQNISLKNLDLGDGLLSLNNLYILQSLSIDHVTMCNNGYVMLCNSISMCKHLKLSLKNLDLGDAIPKLDNLKEFELVNITMSLQFIDYMKSSEQRLLSSCFNSFQRRKTALSIEMTANSCDKCVVNYKNKRDDDDDDDDDDGNADWYYDDDYYYYHGDDDDDECYLEEDDYLDNYVLDYFHL